MTHALATVPPTTADQAAAMQLQAEAEAEVIATLTVDDADSYALADKLLTRVVQRKDAIEAMRTSVTKPINAALRTVNDWFRPAREACERSERHCKREIGAYRLKLDAEAKAAREAAAVAAEAGDSDGLVSALEASTALAVAPTGRATTRMVWKVAAADKTKVPLEYLCVDFKKLDALAADAGATEPAPVVPGVVFELTAIVGARR